MPRFSDVGLDFPLFQGPIEDAVVQGSGKCSECGKAALYRFDDACYSCFRAGRTDHTTDTEHGMVSSEDAERGMTNGIPLDPHHLPNLPLVAHPVDPSFPDDRWYSVEYKVEDLRELTRTPAYHTWQGEQWLFCCGRPAVFVGTLNRGLLAELVSEAGIPPDAMLAHLLSLPEDDVPDLPSAIDHGSVGVYVFRCQECSGLRAHYDCY